MTINRIGFIGGGKMATALAKGIVSKGILSGEQVLVSDPSPDAISAFTREIAGATVANDNFDLVKRVDLVCLAVKPQVVEEALNGLGNSTGDDPLWVSLVAGVRIERLIRLTGSERVIRVMPNTPCLIGEGACGIAGGEAATTSDLDLVQNLCESFGIAVRVREYMLDAVTGLSGSGPAYVFTFMEALAEGGVLMGLTPEDAQQLAAQTVVGAARLVQEQSRLPAELKTKVTSPGGTTVTGLKALEEGGFRAAIMNAVQAAARRSIELGSVERGND